MKLIEGPCDLDEWGYRYDVNVLADAPVPDLRESRLEFELEIFESYVQPPAGEPLH